MPKSPLAADARTLPNSTLSRRAALGAIVSVSAVGVPAARVMLVQSSRTLATLLAQHQSARQTFKASVGELRSARSDLRGRVAGAFGASYSLRADRQRIAENMNDHAKRLVDCANMVEQVAPGSSAKAVAAIERERLAALKRLDEVYAKIDAAEARWRAAVKAENDALRAICAHPCGQTDGLTQKMSYLAAFREEFSDEYHEALFASFLPANDCVDGRSLPTNFQRDDAQ